MKNFLSGTFLRSFKGGKRRDGRRPGAAIMAKAIAIGIVVGTLAGVGGYQGYKVYRHHDAVKTITAMSAEQIKSAEPGRLADLLERLDPESAKDSPFFNKLYHDMRLDPAWVKANEARWQVLMDWIATSPEVAEAKKTWDTASNDERLKMLLPIRDKQAEVLGISDNKARLSLFLEEQQNPDDPECVMGYYDGELLYLNTDPRCGWSDFAEVLDTVVHEQEHHYQDILAEAHGNGEAPPAPEMKTQIRLFSVNEAYYYDGEDDSPAAYHTYANQPLEADAWLIGSKAHKAAGGAGIEGLRRDKLDMGEIMKRHDRVPRGKPKGPTGPAF
jgi:hypothetical protein